MQIKVESLITCLENPSLKETMETWNQVVNEKNDYDYNETINYFKSALKQMLMLLAKINNMELKDVYDNKLNFINCVLDEDNYFFPTNYTLNNTISLREIFQNSVSIIDGTYCIFYQSELKEKFYEFRDLLLQIIDEWVEKIELHKDNVYYIELKKLLMINFEDIAVIQVNYPSDRGFENIEDKYVE